MEARLSLAFLRIGMISRLERRLLLTSGIPIQETSSGILRLNFIQINIQIWNSHLLLHLVLNIIFDICFLRHSEATVKAHANVPFHLEDLLSLSGSGRFRNR